MIIFDKKVKDLEIPKGLGNISVDIASGNTDSISEVKVQGMIDDSQAKQDTDWERTIRQERAATDNAIAAAAAEALHDAEDYTDSGVSYAIETANAYTDSAITLTDYDYVLRSAANAGDVNEFLQWASKFDENDLKKIRVFYKMRVLRFDNGNLSQGWISFQGVDASYMHNNRIYVSRLGFNANQAPSWDERAFDLNTFVNSAQTQEIIDSDYIYLTGGTNVNYWTVTRQSIEYLRSRVEALSVPDSITGQKYHKLHAFLLIDGIWYDFRPIYVSANLDRIYFQCITLTETTLRVEDNKLTVMYFTLWQNATSLPEGTIKTRQIDMS